MSQLGVQVPLVQATPPLAFVHVAPHSPQLLVVPRLVSQPLLVFESQLPQPAAQLSEQEPRLQVPLEFAPPQTVKHAPQWLAFASTFVSQPSLGSLLQSCQLPLQLRISQLFVAHVAVPFATLHVVPHSPQSPSVSRFDSHPSFERPLQSAVPAGQARAMSQTPLWQMGTVSGWLVVHTVVHAPQFASSLSRFVSQPLPWLPSQLPQFVSQPLTSHVLLTQVELAFASAQTFPHVPQLLASLVVGVSQPFAGLPSQSAQPASHVPS